MPGGTCGRPAAWVLLVLLGLHGVGCRVGARGPTESHPRADLAADFPTLRGRSQPEHCAGCHPDHYREWAGSFHARSLTTEGFQKLFGRFVASEESQGRHGRAVPMTCLSCHAPALKDASDQVVDDVAQRVLHGPVEELGGFEVTCTSCHRGEDGRFAGPIRSPVANAVHGSSYSGVYARAQACEGCHAWAPPAVPCSTVAAGWERSQAAKEGKTCQSCHMAERDGPAATAGPVRHVHAHAFPGGRSAELLSHSVGLTVDAAFVEDAVSVTVAVRNLAAHSLPDG